MKQQVLKALANPALLFYVPYSLAVINFVVQFLIFVVLFIAMLLINGFENPLNPMWFLLSVIAVHAAIAVFSRREPQLGQIVSAKLQLFTKKIPDRLAA